MNLIFLCGLQKEVQTLSSHTTCVVWPLFGEIGSQFADGYSVLPNQNWIFLSEVLCYSVSACIGQRSSFFMETVYMERERDYKKLAHVIMETDKSQDLRVSQQVGEIQGRQ